MSVYDPNENIRRVRSALTEAIVGNSKTFEGGRNTVLVVFSGEPAITDQSRVVSFQKYLSLNLASRSLVLSVTPGCLRVWLTFPEADQDLLDQQQALLGTNEFSEVCQNLGITWVQCGRIGRSFKLKDFSKEIMQSS